MAGLRVMTTLARQNREGWQVVITWHVAGGLEALKFIQSVLAANNGRRGSEATHEARGSPPPVLKARCVLSVL